TAPACKHGFLAADDRRGIGLARRPEQAETPGDRSAVVRGGQLDEKWRRYGRYADEQYPEDHIGSELVGGAEHDQAGGTDPPACSPCFAEAHGIRFTIGRRPAAVGAKDHLE